MGEAHPHVHIITTDNSTYQTLNIPANVEFRIEDATQEWLYDEPYDLIHMRDMYELPSYMHVLKQVARYLREGGSFEVATGGPVTLGKNYANSALEKWNGYWAEALQKAGVDYSFDIKSESTMKDAGLRTFKNVHFDVRLGDWTADIEKRRIGRMALVVVCEGIEGVSYRAFTKHLDWTIDETHDFIESVKAELMDPANEPSVRIDYVVARRLPGDAN